MNDWLSNALNMPALTMIWIGGSPSFHWSWGGCKKNTTGRNLKV